MFNPGEIANIVNEARRGNRDAFWAIVRAYGLPLRSYLASHLHNLDDVDDLSQEVFLAAYCSLDSFRAGDDFGAWLRGIARHKVYNHLRRTARWNRVLAALREDIARVVEADLDRSVAADQADFIESLLRCIAQLPDNLRRVVRGGLDGDKPAVLAEALGTSVGAVYNLHYRANQLLRECMEKEVADERGSQ